MTRHDEAAGIEYDPGIAWGTWPRLLAILGALFGITAIGWALLAGLVWLVLLSTVVAGSIIIAAAIVALGLYLAVKGNWRARLLAAAILAGPVWFAAWVVLR